VNLTVGLLKHDAGWVRLLTQIGVSWTVVRDLHAVSAEAFSVLIVNDEPDPDGLKVLRAYVHSGGAVLGDFGSLQSLLECRSSRKRYTFLPPQAFGTFRPSSIVDICGTGRILRGSALASDGSVVQLSEIGNGIAASIPFDCSALVRSCGFTRRNFYAPSERLPSEYVSKVSKGQIREIVTNVLEYLHHARSLPFVHTWYYPDGKPSVFTFRVDTDKGSKTELSKLHDVCVRHGVRGTWFADVKSHEQWLDFFSIFQTQEIGLHCYDHKTDENVEAVRRNFSKGCALLRKAGYEVNGATAPCGTWNEAVDTVYRELNLDYSSEFSLAYDDLPFFPLIGHNSGTANGTSRRPESEAQESTVMQLPIHPVCVGSMRRSGFSSEQMREYFHAWIDNRLRSREPVCLYHHPTHHHWEVFEEIFSSITTMDLPRMTYAEYAGWWKKRTAVVPSFSYDEGKVTLGTGADTELHYRISFPGNEEILTRIDGTFDTNGAQRTKKPEPAVIPEDIARARKFDFRHPLLNFLDYWYKTKS
jgi:hypothetical protein